MSLPVTATDTMRRWMQRVATGRLESFGVAPTSEELAELAEQFHPGQLDPLDLEDLAHEVLEDLRRYPPGRARLKEASRG